MRSALSNVVDDALRKFSVQTSGQAMGIKLDAAVCQPPRASSRRPSIAANVARSLAINA